MIWPFRQISRQPEDALWAHLDACGIPFRAPVTDWVAQMHLTTSGWSDGLDYCIPDTQTPLITGLDAAVRAQVSDQTDYDAAPNYLWGAVQGAGDHRLNYAKAIAGLTHLFGKGDETSASNTVSREWRFGLARVSCTAWPPGKQDRGRNDRHTLFPETVEEALIAIHPAWRPALTEAELAACAKATSLWADPSPRDHPPLTGRSRDWATTLPQGLALTPRGDLLVVRAKGIVDIYLAGRISALKLDRLTPARGGSEAYLSVVITTAGRSGPTDRTCEIASIWGPYDGLDVLAEDLSAKLALPLDTWTGANA